MCFRSERNGTTIRLQRYDQAHWRRIGVTRGETLFWAVFARNSQIGQGTLRGNYVGASGNVALGLGVGAKVLIGGSRRTITLQPLSVEGQIGLNLAVGVANLTLR